MTAFHTRCPETARLETRSIYVPPGEKLPAGEYGFIERYCDNPKCDCRRVTWSVCSKDVPGTVATINFGWESAEYYTQWQHGNAELGEEMTQVTLEPFGTQSGLAPALRVLVENVLVTDPDYVERLKRHYAQFRAALPRAEKPRLAGPRGSNFTPPRKKKR